jgi:hypothetical protein
MPFHFCARSVSFSYFQLLYCFLSARQQVMSAAPSPVVAPSPPVEGTAVKFVLGGLSCCIAALFVRFFLFIIIIISILNRKTVMG